MAIRILRLIEYVYEDEKQAAEDQLRWTMSRWDRCFRMRSAVLPFESVPFSGAVGRRPRPGLEAVRDLIEEVRRPTPEVSGAVGGLAELVQRAEEAIQDGATTTNDGWVRGVEQEDGSWEFPSYPADGEEVWVYDSFYHGVTQGYVLTPRSDRHSWRHHSGSDDVGVRAWMPIDRPKRPEGVVGIDGD